MKEVIGTLVMVVNRFDSDGPLAQFFDVVGTTEDEGILLQDEEGLWELSMTKVQGE